MDNSLMSHIVGVRSWSPFVHSVSRIWNSRLTANCTGY